MKLKNISLQILSSLVLGFLITGFVAGMIVCTDCYRSVINQTLGRFFIGLVFAFYNLFTLGHPPLSGSGDKFLSLQLWSLLVSAIIFVILFFIRKARITK
jgi:hypothetical protein